MAQWFQRLMGLALTLGLAGLVLVATASSSAEDFWLHLSTTAVQGFQAPLWRGLGIASLGAVGLTSVLTGAEWALGLRRPTLPPHFESLGSRGVRDALAEIARRVTSCTENESAHVVTAVEELLRGAMSLEASDIHVSPTTEVVRVTYRVHGTIYEVVTLPIRFAPLFSTRIKVLARLDTALRGVPQDGRLVAVVDGSTLEARVSTLPTETGERIVLRLVRGSVPVPDLGVLGFSPEVSKGLAEILAKPQGLLFVTGPVGSGKTTTLYAAMKHIAATRGKTTNMVTLEDPIEIKLPFATQTQMNPKSGMTFPSTLRSVLRQDPNVIMVGEIRDRETANIAMQAGLTGHLIVTTVHGEGAAGPFARLIEMDVEPFVVASATVGVLAQRLVRTLCTACRKPAAPEPVHHEKFAKLGMTLPEGNYFEHVGCNFCEGQGFSGRTPIGELLTVGAELRRAVGQRCPTGELHDLAVQSGMTPLLADGLARARTGETSLTEVLRVAG